MLSSVLCVDLGDRDERAGLHRRRCLPDTRHDRQGRTGPPAGTGELWPGSDAWPTPGIAWTLQSGICGEPNVKIRKTRQTTKYLVTTSCIRDREKKTEKLISSDVPLFSSLKTGVTMWLLNDEEPRRRRHICCWEYEGSTGFDLYRCAWTHDNFSLLWNKNRSLTFLLETVSHNVYLPSVWSW